MFTLSLIFGRLTALLKPRLVEGVGGGSSPAPRRAGLLPWGLHQLIPSLENLGKGDFLLCRLNLASGKKNIVLHL